MGKNDKMAGFDEFQKIEYEGIAEAHFKTIDAIASFFRYYLIIMSLPATAAALVLSRDKETQQLNLLNLSAQTETIVGVTLMVLSGVGFCLMLYVLNLRMDGILYARTVNAIRKYFYDRSDINIFAKQQLRVLPQTRYLPPFHEPIYFFPVVTTFALIDTAYFFAGFALWSHSYVHDYFPSCFTVIGPLLFSILHFLSYGFRARLREHGDLRTSAIGIDIDGVLNDHRTHFCRILKSITGKVVSPKKIKCLPVSANRGLDVANDDEIAVFHTPAYWTEMPVMNEANEILKKMRKELGLKVHIFSHRPWPVPSDTSANMKSWSSAMVNLRSSTRILGTTKTLRQSLGAINLKIPQTVLLSIRSECEFQVRSIKDRCLAFWRRIYVMLPWVHFIDRITHVWLYKHKLQYDRLIIEKGHTNLASPNARFVNRFNIARRNTLRFFVEDDLEKAEKLAHICDVVFLIDHPYNQKQTGLAANIRRVNSWNEIYREVKSLS